MCFEGVSAPPTVCCGKSVCNDCLLQWMNQRKITCPYYRQKLPNDMIIHSQEGSDALLNDPDFQRRIRAVSLSFRCLFFKGSCVTKKKIFGHLQRFSLNYHNGTVPTHCPACDVIENNPPPPNFEFDAVQEIYDLLHDRLHFLIS